MIAFPRDRAIRAPFQTHPKNAPVATARPALITDCAIWKLGTVCACYDPAPKPRGGHVIISTPSRLDGCEPSERSGPRRSPAPAHTPLHPGSSAHACRPRRREPPTGDAWLHEIKHDCFRVVARKDGARRSPLQPPPQGPRFTLIVELLSPDCARAPASSTEAVDLPVSGPSGKLDRRGRSLPNVPSTSEADLAGLKSKRSAHRCLRRTVLLRNSEVCLQKASKRRKTPPFAVRHRCYALRRANQDAYSARFIRCAYNSR